MPKKPVVSKSQFIRDRLHLTPAETASQATKAGVKLTRGMIYSVRSAASKSKPNGAKPNGSPKKSGQSNALELGGLESAIRSIVQDEIRKAFAKLA